MSWFWVEFNLSQRAQADLSSETLKHLAGVSWGTMAALCAQRQEVEVQMEAYPLSLYLAAALLTGWLFQAAVGGLLKRLGSQASHSPGGSPEFITSECLEHLMCQRPRNL